jgi:hypothetical protein
LSFVALELVLKSSKEQALAFFVSQELSFLF